MAKFTQVRADAFESIQINAGVLLNSFDPSSGTFNKTNILGTTSGGVTFNSNLSTTDFGEDMDNVPANTWQLKRVEQFSPVLSGTFVSVNTALTRMLTGAADTTLGSSGAPDHIVPRNSLKETDFNTVWLVGDYSDKNGASNGGFIAIRIKHGFSTGGLQIKTDKNKKGQFSFELTGHYDIENVDDVPFDIYVKVGTDEADWTITSPEDKSVTAGANTSFAVNITGATGTPEYQWQRKVTGATSFSDVEGAVSATLNLYDVSTNMDNWQYRCKVAADGAIKYSDAATLSVSAGA